MELLISLWLNICNKYYSIWACAFCQKFHRMKDDKQNGVLLAHELASQQDQEPMQQEDDVPI